MNVLSQLHPYLLWHYFEEVCKIPRLSKQESKIREYLRNFAIEKNLEFKEDEAGNILIVRDASQGMESRKTIVLQSHLDMVGEKKFDYSHNWQSDPIIPIIKDNWVGTNGTTLGADDGIGIASQLAILTDKEIIAGKIECLFTVDEESGMTGAINLKPDFFTGKTLLNLDSEDEGILFIGCAGGMDTVGTMKYKPVKTNHGQAALEITLTGLHGGHSGDEIHKGYANAVKVINHILWELTNESLVFISLFDGGNLRNAIPREACAVLVLELKNIDLVKNKIEFFRSAIIEEFGELEMDLLLTIKEVPVPEYVVDLASQKKLLGLINCCPHGVIAWSKEMDDLVETSTNLASVKFCENNTIKIITTQRSSIESSKHEVAGIVESCMRIGGAEVTHSDGYPGWEPNMNSEILDITRKSYLKLFGKEAQVRAIHAGLECGLIYQKIKDIDMISFGPTIKGAHTPDEKIEIKTAQMFWDLLLDVIANIPEEKS
ncbi:MAG TPA: aminoacyl-histidine dipeptidase [Bacteroidales bacterium]|nr:aminoacyl-histidine dipeptidase [Bacteroidales bacterium]